MMTTWIFSLLLGCELMAPVLQLLIRLCHYDGASESAEVEGRRRQAPSWPFLASRYLSEVLITSDVISKSVLTLLYWDLNSVLGSLTLKKLSVNSPSCLSWAFHLFIWGRKH